MAGGAGLLQVLADRQLLAHQVHGLADPARGFVQRLAPGVVKPGFGLDQLRPGVQFRREVQVGHVDFGGESGSAGLGRAQAGGCLAHIGLGARGVELGKDLPGLDDVVLPYVQRGEDAAFQRLDHLFARRRRHLALAGRHLIQNRDGGPDEKRRQQGHNHPDHPGSARQAEVGCVVIKVEAA